MASIPTVDFSQYQWVVNDTNYLTKWNNFQTAINTLQANINKFGAEAKAESDSAIGIAQSLIEAYNVNVLEPFKAKCTLGFDYLIGEYFLDDGVARTNTTDFTDLGIINRTEDVYLESADGNIRPYATTEIARSFEDGFKVGAWSGETRTNTAPFSNDPGNWAITAGAILESSTVINGIARARVRLPHGTEGAINFGALISDGVWTISARIRVVDGWDDSTLCTSVSGDAGNFRIVYTPPKEGTWGWVERVSDVTGGNGDARIIRRLNNAAPDIVLDVEAQQVEKASNRSPYIPVDTATPVTRIGSSEAIDLGSAFNSRRGAVYIEAKDVKPNSSSDFGSVFTLDDGTSDNRIRLHRRRNGRYTVNLVSIGVDQFDFHQHLAGDDIRCIVSWDDKRGAFACMNGIVFTSSQNIDAPVGIYQKPLPLALIGQMNECQWYYSPAPVTQAEAIALTEESEL